MNQAGEPEKFATVYERGGKLYFHSNSLTTVGVWILSEPVLTTGADAVAVGRAVRACLAASRGGVPHPKQPEWSGLTKPLLLLAGAKSYNAFAKGAKSVQVDMNAGVIAVVPNRNGGPREGFTSLDDKSRTLTPNSDEELGAAVLAALATAE